MISVKHGLPEMVFKANWVISDPVLLPTSQSVCDKGCIWNCVFSTPPPQLQPHHYTTLILLFFFLSIPYSACRNMTWMRVREHAPGPQQSESTTIPSLAGHRRTTWSESFEQSLQEATLAPWGKLPQLQEGRYCPSLSSVLLALQLCLQCNLATTDCFFVTLKNYQQW